MPTSAKAQTRDAPRNPCHNLTNALRHPRPPRRTRPRRHPVGPRRSASAGVPDAAAPGGGPDRHGGAPDRRPVRGQAAEPYAANALQSQVSRLRKRLSLDIEATPAGYRLAVGPDDVDVHRFERLAAEGERALTAGDPSQAAALLGEALGLWRGPALADLPAAFGGRLDEIRLTAAQTRIEAELALGSGGGLVPELRELIAAHPLSERLYGQLMRALHADGRPAEALAVYEEVRRVLADELGADPSAELSGLHVELLRGREPARGRGVPAQLTRFVGRTDELARIDTLLARARLVTLTGPGGAGKTRLAAEVARDRADVCWAELAPLAAWGAGAVRAARGARGA